MAHFWSPQEVDRRAWTPAENARNFFMIRFGFNFILLLISLFGCYLIVIKAQTIPFTMVQNDDSRAYYAKPVPYRLNQDLMRADIEDVLTVLFARTEAGPLYELPKAPSKDPKAPKPKAPAIPYLAELISPRVLHGAIDPLNIKDKLGASKGYTQQLVVLDVKFEKVTPTAITALVKSDFRVHSDQQYASSLVYFNTRWLYAGRTLHNPLGWKLTDIILVPESYYTEDKQQDLIKAQTQVSTDDDSDINASQDNSASTAPATATNAPPVPPSTSAPVTNTPPVPDSQSNTHSSLGTEN